MLFMVLVMAAAMPAAGETDAATTSEAPSSVKCSAKKDPHGSWQGSTEPRGTYTLHCDHGYGVEGNRTVTLVCSEDGHWPADPWCENIDDCESLIHDCGPAGLCVDHKGKAQCLCEHGAIMHKADNGEVVCFLPGDSEQCGQKNCGSHGVCVDLRNYQDSFDTGDTAFRCSCEQGYHDDGHSCQPRDCGGQNDRMGTWTGSSLYGGEYTLHCDDDAFVWGGSQKAITIACPMSGVWTNHPRCTSPMREASDANRARMIFWANFGASGLCICAAALAAGLTMGLLSILPREMEIIQHTRNEDCATEEERMKLKTQKSAAQLVLPVLQDRHLLLVTLLLLNALANEALPIFLDELVSPFVAVLLSVTFVLLCGEVLPSAVFTGPLQLIIASTFVPVVKVLQCFLYVIAKPIAVLLDRHLPHDTEDLYTRAEIRAVLGLHGKADPGPATSTPARVEPSTLVAVEEAAVGLLGSVVEPLRNICDPPTAVVVGMQDEEDAGPPLDPLEVQLCDGVIGLGDKKVMDSAAFKDLRRCDRAFFVAASSSTATSVAAAALRADTEAVVVFKSLRRVRWPFEAPFEELLAILRIEDLLVATAEHVTVGDLCTIVGQPPIVGTDYTVTDSLDALIDVGVPSGFAVIQRDEEFLGIFDGEEALTALLLPPLPPPSRLKSDMSLDKRLAALAAVADALQPPADAPDVPLASLGAIKEERSAKSLGV